MFMTDNVRVNLSLEDLLQENQLEFAPHVKMDIMVWRCVFALNRIYITLLIIPVNSHNWIVHHSIYNLHRSLTGSDASTVSVMLVAL